MIVGVLAFQGDVREHIDVLTQMHVPSVLVRRKEDLAKIDALIIPGGESTVIAKFLWKTGVGKEVQRRLKDRKHPFRVYGTCAGAIVLAKKATGKNAPKPLGLIDITVDRNAYGTQADSFEAQLRVKGRSETIDASFIRAPRITKTGKGVIVLAEFSGDPVLVQQGNVLVGTFHPEMRSEGAIHRYFLTMGRKRA